jgi:hypothetical protein
MALQHPLFVVPAVPQFHVMAKGSTFRSAWGEGKEIVQLGGWEPERSKYSIDERQTEQTIQQARLSVSEVAHEKCRYL